MPENWLRPITNYVLIRVINGRVQEFNRGLRGLLLLACGMANFEKFWQQGHYTIK